MSQVYNQWIQDYSQTVNQKQSSQKCIISQFQNTFQTIKTFTEELRQLPIQITAKEDSQITNYTTTLINYLSHSKALLNQKLYRNALISLGNFLGIKFGFFKKQFLSQKFLKNLIHYFSILCEKQNQPDFNSLIYPIFYLIVLFIYNGDKQVGKILNEKLFEKKFLKGLCSIDFIIGNRVQRYLPVIIAFIAKGSLNTQNILILKQLILKNLHFSQIEKNHFHFIYSLRMIINKQSFTLGQIKKYSLIQTIFKFLNTESHSQQHLTMILQVLKHILKRHQILGYKLSNAAFLNVLQKTYKICPSQSLSILQIVSPCLPYQYKLAMFESHVSKLRFYSDKINNQLSQKQLQSLKIISIVIQCMSYFDILQFLSKYSLESIIKRAFSSDIKLQNSEQIMIINLLTKIFMTVNKINPVITYNYISILSAYKECNRRVQLFYQQFCSPQQFQKLNELS